MLKATEIFGTRYLVDDYLDEWRFILSCVFGAGSYKENMYDQSLKHAIEEFKKNNKIEVDMADAVFTTGVWRYISGRIIDLAGDFVICDTEDADRDEFFKELMKVATAGDTTGVPLPPRPTDISELGKWVADLDPETIYNAIGTDEPYAFCTLIQLMRPEIKIKAAFSPWFKYVHDVFMDVMLKESAEFWYITNATNDTIWHTECRDDGEVHITNMGDISKEEFIRKYTTIPKEIGTVKYNPATASKEWQKAVHVITSDTVAYLKKRPKTMMSFWEV